MEEENTSDALSSLYDVIISLVPEFSVKDVINSFVPGLLGSESGSVARLFSSQSASHSGGYGDDCCPPVVDPYTWLALIAGIALATYFLRVVIIVKMPPGRRKRDIGQMYEDREEERDKAENLVGAVFSGRTYIF